MNNTLRELKELAELRDNGSITENEFNMFKENVLRINSKTTNKPQNHQKNDFLIEDTVYRKSMDQSIAFFVAGIVVIVAGAVIIFLFGR